MAKYNYFVVKWNYLLKQLNLKNVAYALLVFAATVSFWVLYGGSYVSLSNHYPDAEKAKAIQPFMTGLIVPLLTLGSTLLIIENLRTAALQNFSSNFFKLIDLHHSLLNQISSAVEPISNEKEPSIKRAFFDDLAFRISIDFYGKTIESIDHLGEKINYPPNADISIGDAVGHQKLIIIYDYYFQIHNSDLGHYFRNLYHIVKFVESSNFNKSVKGQHLKILRAQLSNYELLLLAYNCIHSNGCEKFKPLVEKYELLKSLITEENLTATRVKRIVDVDILRDAYPHFNKYKPKKP